MELIIFFLNFGFLPANIEFEDISFSENIDYCTNIMHDPRLEFDYYNNCNSDEANMYIMLVKKHLN